LEYIDVPNKPAFPTPDQMRSRSQHLGYGRTTVPNFQTNADVNVLVQDRLLPATVEEWRLMDEQKVLSLRTATTRQGAGHHSVNQGSVRKERAARGEYISHFFKYSRVFLVCLLPPSEFLVLYFS
jgi:hypothetical protein